MVEYFIRRGLEQRSYLWNAFCLWLLRLRRKIWKNGKELSSKSSLSLGQYPEDIKIRGVFTLSPPCLLGSAKFLMPLGAENCGKGLRCREIGPAVEGGEWEMWEEGDDWKKPLIVNRRRKGVKLTQTRRGRKQKCLEALGFACRSPIIQPAFPFLFPSLLCFGKLCRVRFEHRHTMYYSTYVRTNQASMLWQLKIPKMPTSYTACYGSSCRRYWRKQSKEQKIMLITTHVCQAAFTAHFVLKTWNVSRSKLSEPAAWNSKLL